MPRGCGSGAIIFIPARFASARFPGKPLAELRGAGGKAKSLIRRSWEAARAVKGADAVYVVTDDARIREAAEGFGADVLMTSPECRNGTERCAEAVGLLREVPQIVVNLQGDAPLTPSWYVEDLIAAMNADPEVSVATPVLATSGRHLEKLREDRRRGRVGGTTALVDHAGNAIYFSKEVLPFTPRSYGEEERTPVLHHVGVYAYTPGALLRYMELPQGTYERLEGLEQLRFLEYGIPVRCVEVAARGAEFWELNNPSDIEIIEAILRERGIE